MYERVGIALLVKWRTRFNFLAVKEIRFEPRQLLLFLTTYLHSPNTKTADRFVFLLREPRDMLYFPTPHVQVVIGMMNKGLTANKYSH